MGSYHIRNRIKIYKTGCYQLEVRKVRENQSIREKPPQNLNSPLFRCHEEEEDPTKEMEKILMG